MLFAGSFGVVPTSRWPATIRMLQPQSVSTDSQGVYVKMGELFVEEWGYFVPWNAVAFDPSASGDPSYRALGSDVYWYEIKG